MERKNVTEYKDVVSDDRLPMPTLHEVKESSKPELKGMVFEVESKMVKYYENGEDGDSDVINLVCRYGLMALDDVIDIVDAFDGYMEYYLNDALIPLLELMEGNKEEVEFFKSKIGGVLEYIRSRFSDFDFYTGGQAYFEFEELEDTCPCYPPYPRGTLVMADKASNPPTFLYLVHGLVGRDNSQVERFLSHCSETGAFTPSTLSAIQKEQQKQMEEQQQQDEEAEVEEF